MAVRIRLSRLGRIHRPYYRIVAIDGRCHREGKTNEVLGTYDPLLKDKNIQVDMARVEAWVKLGAQVSLPLARLLAHNGYALPPVPKTENVRASVKKDGKKWVAPTRRALRKHAAKVKGVRKAALAAEAAAKAAAKAAEAPAEAPKA